MAGTVDHGSACSGGELGRPQNQNQNAQCFRCKPLLNRAAASASASCCWLMLLSLLPSAALCCLLLGVDTPTHIVATHTKYTKHTAAAKAHRNHMFMFPLALLQCYCITHGPPGSMLLAVTVQQQQSCELSRLRQPQTGICAYVYVCTSVCTRYVCAECAVTRSVHTNSTARQQQQQQYNGSCVSNSRPCASGHGVCECGWCTAGHRNTTISSRPTAAVFQTLVLVPVVTVYVSVVGAQQDIETRRYLHVQCNNQTHIVGPHTRYMKHAAVAKAVARTCHRKACVHHDILATPPGFQLNPIPKKKLVSDICFQFNWPLFSPAVATIYLLVYSDRFITSTQCTKLLHVTFAYFPRPFLVTHPVPPSTVYVLPHYDASSAPSCFTTRALPCTFLLQAA